MRLANISFIMFCAMAETAKAIITEIISIVFFIMGAKLVKSC